MTLGEKLADYRKQSGLTQQQLGQELNVSPQAVSKWENDQAEPDIGTLRKLSNLYHISLDQLLGSENVSKEERSEEFQPTATAEEVAAGAAQAAAEAVREEMRAQAEEERPIGFCTECGRSLFAKDVGEKTPKIICKDCVARRKAAAEAKRKEEARKAAARLRADRADLKKHIIWGILIGIAAGGTALGVFIAAHYPIVGIVSCVLLLLMGTVCLFEGPVNTVLDVMFHCSVRFPGLIFSLDLDGIIWFITVKLIFGILGFLVGVACGILGVIVAMVLAPFQFPFTMFKIHDAWRTGKCDDILP